MSRLLLVAALVPFLPLGAQAPAVVPDSVLVASALAPLPAEFRASATVLRWTAPWVTAPLRPGGGPMICLADNPHVEGFHVACYHRDLEPFMARGRALRAAGTTARAAVDSIRFAEVASGALPMPAAGMLWQLTGGWDAVDPATGAITGTMRPLYVVYLPGATAESTGLPLTAAPGTPWLMSPGTPSAHIMFVPRM